MSTVTSNTAAGKVMPSGEKNALVSIQNLRVWFELRRFGFSHAGYVHAVDGVNFDLATGEAIAVVGESGCGKSSLMKTILGLYKPTEGDIVFDGTRMSEYDRAKMRWYDARVGYIQQDPYGALPPFMTIFRVLEEPTTSAAASPTSPRRTSAAWRCAAASSSPCRSR